MSGFMISKDNLAAYANSLSIGDYVTIKAGYNEKKVTGRIINKFPFLCQVEYDKGGGETAWDCATWFDVYQMNN